MTKKTILTAFAAAATVWACAQTQYRARIAVLGNDIAKGSADTTVVQTAQSYQNILIPAGGFAAETSAAAPYAPGLDGVCGTTVVEGMRPTVPTLFHFIDLSLPADEISRRLTQPAPPDFVIYMSDAQTDAQTLQALQAIAGVPMVFVQPANHGNEWAKRPLQCQYEAPDGRTAWAMYDLCRQYPDRFVMGAEGYAFDYCPDMRTPTAASMAAMGAVAGQRINGGTKGAPLHITATEAADSRITLTLNTAAVADTVNVAPAPALGFELWRGAGTDRARRLNITAATLKDNTVTLDVAETPMPGDLVVYGSAATGTGCRSGVRGNIALADGTAHLPLLATTLDAVQRTGVNITGRITDTAGKPVAGVTVSDGYDFAVTAADGRYALASDKKLGYVFYVLPKGYEPQTTDTWRVQNFALLDGSDKSVAEEHDFVLVAADNTEHVFVVGTDAHLAKRTNDLAQFRDGYVARLKRFAAENPGKRIYSTILGDLSWDQYWYQNAYDLTSVTESLTKYGYPFMLFPVMGNHDNDPSVTGAGTDLGASAPFRRIIAPTYYSYNLGDVHYVVLDDIVYRNTVTAGKTYPEGVAGDRDYGKYYTDAQLEWLRRDLDAIVDKSTPLVIMAHAQNWQVSANTFAVTTSMENSAAHALARVVADFADVQILTGHTHHNFHARPAEYPNIREHNLAAICATWWWTGKLTGRHICVDGSPGGFSAYTANGRDISHKMHAVEGEDDLQMRIYDMNAVKAAYADDDDIKAYLKAYTSRNNYATVADNTVYVNVFDYDTDWTVEIFENDTPLTVTRITADDPLHMITYDVPRYAAAQTVTSGFVTIKNNHMFSARAATAGAPVTVRVTDGAGNVYTRTLQRPGTFDTALK